MGGGDEPHSGTGARTVVAVLCVIGAILPVVLSILRYHLGGSGSDFWPLWEAGRNALQGEPVYTGRYIFTYPPHSLFLFAPFSLLPFGWALLLFNFAGLGFFAFAARPYLPKGFPLTLAICSPATLFCLFLGQSGLFLAGLWLLAFRGQWWAVAALSFKPHLGLLSILALKGWPDLVRTAILLMLLVMTSAFVFGPNLWPEFATALLEQSDRIGVREQWFVMGVSPAIGYGLWGWMAFAIPAGFLLTKKVTPFTAATAAILISPYGFHYDMAVACFGFAIAIYHHWPVLNPYCRAALVGGFLAPVIVNGGTWFVPPILLGALWVQVSLGTEKCPSRTSADP